MAEELRPRKHGNVFLRFCIVSSNELVVLDSLENSKQYKNAGKRFRVYGALNENEQNVVQMVYANLRNVSSVFSEPFGYINR